jgi:hypothetical protein
MFFLNLAKVSMSRVQVAGTSCAGTQAILCWPRMGSFMTWARLAMVTSRVLSSRLCFLHFLQALNCAVVFP